MSSASVPMGIYDYDRRARQQQPFAATTGAASVMEPEVKFVVSRAAAPSSDNDDARPNDKVLRRLVQNREAARKSRLRKKAYIQTLESSKMKLARLEQELTYVRRQQQVHSAAPGIAESATLPPPPLLAVAGPAALELEYARWVEEQGRHAADLRAALHAQASEVQLRVLVDAGLAHYDALFRLKSSAARRDAFLVLSGAWRAPAERFFLWIGGLRPSDVLRTLAPQMDPPLAEEQAAAVRALQQTARQLEDALAQGLERLQQTLAEALLVVAAVDGDGGGGGGGYAAAQQMAGALGRLGDLAGIVDQADHLRQQTLRNMRKILTPRQAARGMLALADYCQRMRALGSLWAARPREPA